MIIFNVAATAASSRRWYGTDRSHLAGDGVGYEAAGNGWRWFNANSSGHPLASQHRPRRGAARIAFAFRTFQCARLQAPSFPSFSNPVTCEQARLVKTVNLQGGPATGSPGRDRRLARRGVAHRRADRYRLGHQPVHAAAAGRRAAARGWRPVRRVGSMYSQATVMAWLMCGGVAAAHVGQVGAVPP